MDGRPLRRSFQSQCVRIHSLTFEEEREKKKKERKRMKKVRERDIVEEGQHKGCLQGIFSKTLVVTKRYNQDRSYRSYKTSDAGMAHYVI